MSTKKIPKVEFNKWIAELINYQKTFGIQRKKDKDDRYEFDILKDPKDLKLDYDVAIQAPKKYFQPPCETLLKFDKKQHYHSVLNDETFTVIGIHPYDMIAINQMDELFKQDHYDVHYFARRKAATVIASDVITPSENVFAASMNTAVVDEGFDILLTDIGNSYVLEIKTDKGRKAANLAPDIEDATEKDIQMRKKVWENNKKKLNKHQLKYKPSYLPRLLERAYEHPVWKEKAETCFSCGSCTQVCPTCYCFDVQDDFDWDLESGERERKWDSCQLKGFTEVAGGHEFRDKRYMRYRHRFYRKAKYVPSKIGGQMACVGCGRCIEACLPDIANPVKVYNRLIDDLGIG